VAQIEGRNGSKEGGEAWDKALEEIHAAASLTAVMAACGPEERALETARGGAFTNAWASHPIQGSLSLTGLRLCAPPLAVAGAHCRQHPVSCVGWCEAPADRDPRVLSVGLGLWLTGAAFFAEGANGGLPPAPGVRRKTVHRSKFPEESRRRSPTKPRSRSPQKRLAPP
jgi:hypothetical protein